MKLRNPLMAGLIIPLLFACAKEKPRGGLYWAEFYTVDSNGFNVTLYDSGVEVSAPSETSLTINGSTLSKKGDHISGTIGQMKPFTLSISGLAIDGTWKRKGGYYKIIGSYTAYTTTGENYGTFHMESY